MAKIHLKFVFFSYFASYPPLSFPFLCYKYLFRNKKRVRFFALFFILLLFFVNDMGNIHVFVLCFVHAVLVDFQYRTAV